MFLPFGETWVRLRPGTRTSAYSGEPVDDWSAATELPIGGCTTDAGTSTLTDGVDIATLSNTRTWYGPPGADVQAGDRLRDPRGRVWQVVGEPVDLTHAFTGWQPGMSATIQRATS